jgi:maltose alpha-D-glucosyltransferase/alpha-amylase
VVQARSGVPPEARELLASFMPLVSQLGQRIAELHLALASDHNDPAFCPEPFSLLHQRSLYQSARALLRRTFDVLAEGIDTLPENMTGAAREVLASRRTIDTRLRRIYRKKLEAKRIRCHGDLHLGQVLHTGRDFMIIDFEGEPARSLGERRFKRSPLRDVAAMMRSFHYAAMNTLYIGRERPEDVRTLRPWSESWADWASVAFLSSWLTTFEPAGVIPSDDEELCLLLEFYLLEKCIYEVGYELDNRPEWVGVPLSGLRTLLHETSP